MLSAVLVLVLCLAAARGDSVVVTTPAGPALNSSGQSGQPEIYSMHITSHIQYRYASTVVSSRVANQASSAQEIFFSCVIPETAFITGFLMEIDGVVYKAEVREKEEAKRQYDAAVSQGLGAAHVAQSARNSNRFKVSVNIEAQRKVTFNLTYEELMKRELSFYKLAIIVDPGQVVRDLLVEVMINESSPIRNLQVPTLRESNEIDSEGYSEEDPYAVVEVFNRSTAVVRWAPTEEQQKALRADGVKGQLVVRYDLDRSQHPEQILVNEGYFVHFFSPEDLEPLPKHVVFVIDVSGSMWGRKIEQVRDAMERILSDLSPADYFSFVTFSTSVKVWDSEHPLSLQHTNVFVVDTEESEILNSSVVAATSDNINKAKEFVRRLDTYASTNIHGALLKGLQVAELGRRLVHGHTEPMVIFLTDGEPNVGESDPARIVASVSEANTARVAVFSLSFGEYADMPFLRKLSLRNSGFARKIYEASDAALQLRDFYRQVASPLLANVTFQYTPEQIEEESLSTTNFNTLFRGSELVVAGKLKSNSLAGTLTARGVNGSFTLDYSPAIFLDFERHNSTPTFMERLWGYLSIQQLLERETAGSGNSSALRERALNLALRYSFVTPLTSLLVVKPNETSSTDLEEADSSSSGHPPPQQAPMQYYPRTGTPGASQMHIIPSSILGGPGGSYPSIAQDIQDSMMLSPTGYYSLTTTQIPYMTTVLHEELRVVPLDSVTWLNRTGNSSTVVLQGNPGAPPEILLVKGANETNEAHGTCHTAIGGPGHCRHLVHCALDFFQSSVYTYFPFLCRIDNYAGVCCPDSLQPVTETN